MPRLPASQLVAMILPHQCVACRSFADSNGLCATCWNALSPITAPMCRICGLPLPELLTEAVCATCWSSPPPLAAMRAALRYDDASRGLILKMKHGDGLQLVPFLGRLLATYFTALARDNPLVVPVPLHRWRYLRRRFNQSAELARFLCHHTGKGEFAPDIALRTRATRSQGGLSRQARHRNLARAFALTDRGKRVVPGRPVIIIDDVMTTGATLLSLTGTLQKAQAGPVSSLVIARVL